MKDVFHLEFFFHITVITLALVDCGGSTDNDSGENVKVMMIHKGLARTFPYIPLRGKFEQDNFLQSSQCSLQFCNRTFFNRIKK